MFPSGSPPVVRRRAGELLGAVREAVKAVPSSSAAVDTSEDPRTEIALPSQEITAVLSRQLSSATQDRDIWAASKDGLQI
jgi:hypothetical protein